MKTKIFILSSLLLSVFLIIFIVYAADADLDGVEDGTDNCPTVYNPHQYDFNYNGTGDVCEELIVYKEEEMLFILGPDPYDSLASGETIMLRGDAIFGLGGVVSSQDDDTDEKMEITATVDLFLTGPSLYLGDLTLSGTADSFYEEKFVGFEFPADAYLSKHFTLFSASSGQVFLAYSGTLPGSGLFNKIEEGVVTARPPRRGNPLCREPDSSTGAINKQPIGVYFSGDVEPIGWIILNCDEFWRDKYNAEQLPPPPPVRLFPEGLFEYEGLDSEMKIEIDIPIEGIQGTDTIVLRGPVILDGEKQGGTPATIDIEIVEMTLQGEGGVVIIGQPLPLGNGEIGKGQIQQMFDKPLHIEGFDVPMEFPAESYFDVFFEIQVNGHAYYPFTYENEQCTAGIRLHAHSSIKEIPWWHSTYCGSGVLEIYTGFDGSGATVGGQVGTIGNICLELIPSESSPLRSTIGSQITYDDVDLSINTFSTLRNIIVGDTYSFIMNFINNLGATTNENTRIRTPFYFKAPVGTGVGSGESGNIRYNVKFFADP